MRSSRSCVVEGCGNPARAQGDDCRKHYKLAWQREKRNQEKFEKSMVSLDDSTYALNVKWYREWYQEQD